MTRALTKFTRVPERFTRMLEEDKITFEDHTVMIYLAGRCDPHTGEWVGTLATLQDKIRLRRSAELLRQRLHHLRNLGEVSFDSRPGQRKPWRIKVVGAGWGLPGDADLQGTSNSTVRKFGGALEVDLQPDGGDVPPNPHETARSSDRQPPTAATGARTDRDVDVDLGQDQDLDTGADGVAEAPPRPAEEDDREAAWRDLVDLLDDADDHTLAVFQRNFGELTAAEIRYVADEILKRADGYRGRDAPDSPSGYAFRILERRLGGYNGTPDLPARWSAA